MFHYITLQTIRQPTVLKSGHKIKLALTNNKNKTKQEVFSNVLKLQVIWVFTVAISTHS